MSSQRRIDSSRANGAKSRGPVTPEGRARSDMAPATHGLTARRVLLENESETDFQVLRDLCLRHFQPRDDYEKDLVEQLVAARWRLDRTWAYETALLEVEIGRREPEIEKEFKSCSEEVRNALALRALYEESPVLAGLSRYEVRFRRICDKIAKRLDSLRANRKTHEEPSSSPADLRPSGGTPPPSNCPPSPSEPATPDVAQALQPAASALQPTPDVSVTEPRPSGSGRPARRATVPCVFRRATSDERRAGRKRVPLC